MGHGEAQAAAKNFEMRLVSRKAESAKIVNDVIDLGPHSRMTPEQALAYAAREKWDKVIICGFHEGEVELVVRSSSMNREVALWIAVHLKLWILGPL